MVSKLFWMLKMLKHILTRGFSVITLKPKYQIVRVEDGIILPYRYITKFSADRACRDCNYWSKNYKVEEIKENL